MTKIVVKLKEFLSLLNKTKEAPQPEFIFRTNPKR